MNPNGRFLVPNNIVTRSLADPGETDTCLTGAIYIGDVAEVSKTPQEERGWSYFKKSQVNSPPTRLHYCEIGSPLRGPTLTLLVGSKAWGEVDLETLS